METPFPSSRVASCYTVNTSQVRSFMNDEPDRENGFRTWMLLLVFSLFEEQTEKLIDKCLRSLRKLNTDE